MSEETIDYKGYTINIHQDSDPMDPRTDFYNLGTMLCWHSQCNLGDKKAAQELYDYCYEKSAKFRRWVEDEGESRPKEWAHIHNMSQELTQKMATTAEDLGAVILPLHLYDHSGLTMNTSGFHCSWDSGQVGFIFLTREKAMHEYSWNRWTKERRKRIESYLTREVETYDNYLTGSIYGYTIYDPNCDEIDGSCWGFFGYDHKKSGLLEMAQSDVDCEIEHRNKEAQKERVKRLHELKGLIKNHVPLEIRQHKMEAWA